jgi:hypothetical protein
MPTIRRYQIILKLYYRRIAITFLMMQQLLEVAVTEVWSDSATVVGAEICGKMWLGSGVNLQEGHE